mmetsp:Transcript_28349/g.28643  ORF Transcript_28349/g.28643 Transcript_28349/m.28643 type:complete len:108 (-) Transcript_28349:83-406(-)
MQVVPKVAQCLVRTKVFSRLLRPTVMYCQSLGTSPYELGKHRSDAEELVDKVAPIEIKGNMAICDGGGGALGHPIEYIQLNNVYGTIGVCKYCGLRFKKAKGSHGHH